MYWLSQIKETAMTSIPEALQDAIEKERGNLTRAEALLGCLVIAIEYGEKDLKDAPDYGLVVKIAHELVHASIDKLDSIYLEQTLDE
jgi:hypothetical protein